MVSVILTSYNHAKYVKKSILSILKQEGVYIELIIIDNASTDGTQQVIEETIKDYEEVIYFPQRKNIGNCKAFNLGLRFAHGEYVIDLSADDYFYEDGIRHLYQAAKRSMMSEGVVFADLQYVNEAGVPLGTFYTRDEEGHLEEYVRDGKIYDQVLSVPPHLSACSMLIKRDVLEYTQGYDESLAYEDYDFWIRSARKYRYLFVDQIVMAKRVVTNSLGDRFYWKGKNALLESTLKICQKALALNENDREDRALAKSVRYHMRLSLFTENYELAIQYADLLQQLDKFSKSDRLILLLSHYEVPLYSFYKMRVKWRKIWNYVPFL